MSSSYAKNSAVNRIAVSADEVAAVYWMTPEEVYDHPEAADYLIDYIRRAEEVRKNGIRI